MKKNRCTIGTEMLDKLDEVISEPEQMDEWMDYLKKKDSAFYLWVQERTGQAISALAPKINIRMADASGIAHSMLCAFLSGYILNHMSVDEEISRRLSQEEDYRTWLGGLFPASYYDFDITGLEKSDDKYKAKTAFLRNMEKQKSLLEEQNTKIPAFQKHKQEIEKLLMSKVREDCDQQSQLWDGDDGDRPF